MSNQETRDDTLIELYNVKKIYKRGREDVVGIRGVSLVVKKGDFIVVCGPSGSGKTTLLNLMSGMDRSTAGDILFERRNIRDLSEEELTKLRNEKIGFIFQFFNLIESMTALENVMSPLMPNKDLPDKEIENRALQALGTVGMLDKKDSLPNQLSGGEQQRVAIARAIVTNPEIIFADEPIAQLDEENARNIIDLLTGLNQQRRTTIILATASRDLADKLKNVATKMVFLERGDIVEIQERRGNRWVRVSSSSP